MNTGIPSWIVLIMTMAIAVAGLLLAGKGVDTGMELAGWLLFAFGVAFAFRLAGKMAVDRGEG